MKRVYPFNLIRNVFLFLIAGEIFIKYKYLLKRRKVSFRSKVVVITGGTRGLGLILARSFASEGSKVAVLARNEVELKNTEAQLKEIGESVLALKCDISDNDQVQKAVADIVNRFNSIDVLVNNAGIIQVGPLQNMKREDFEKAMAVNAWGTFNMTMAVLPHMKQQKNGRIVNTTSLGGKIAVPHLLPYVFSKFAMVGFSEGLQAEVVKNGITVTTVIPGLMRTGSPINAQFKGNYRREFKWFSFMDSFPPVSIDPKKAAAKIIESCRNGEPVLVLTLAAHAAILFSACFPTLTAKILAFTNFFLPGPTANEGT
jgi:NAD(P)-dependent dehydrogenase (short-subunit alcohol dehydrogenase family)